MTLSRSQLHIIQHSLGLDQYGRGKEYRNHFVTGPGSKDFSDCEALVEAACMTVRRDNGLSGGPGNHCYTVTDWGRLKMQEQSPEPPRLSRAKARWSEYQQDADCFNGFHHWLKYKQHRKLEHGESY